jgi:hypothetical protein
MSRRTAVLWALSAAVVAHPKEAAPQVLLGYFDSDSRFAVQRAIKGAAARLARPSCQDVLSDFADASNHTLRTTLRVKGRSPTEAFAALRFVDSHAALQCTAGTTLAFAQTGSPLIHVCGRQFIEGFMQDRMTAEIIVIHEFLHSLGLGENPPSSQAITEQVVVRCGG